MESAFAPATDSGLILGLFRHGQAAKRDAEEYPNDDSRPLTDKGAKTVKRCAKGLSAIGFAPNLIVTSPVRRAQETSELLIKAFELPDSSLKVLHALHYEAPLRLAMTRLSRIKLHGHVLVVGHEPWLGNFLSLLLTGRRSRAFPMRKAGFAAAAVEKPAPGQGRLIAFLPPETLESLG